MPAQSIRKLWMVPAEARARPMDVELKARTPVRFVDYSGKVRLSTAWKA
jgi:hypothetical protein